MTYNNDARCPVKQCYGYCSDDGQIAHILLIFGDPGHIPTSNKISVYIVCEMKIKLL